MTSQLTVPELRDSLSSLSLSAHGNKVELQKRLRKAQRRIRQAEERMARAKREEGDGVWRPKYRRFLVLDVEATCEEAIFQGGPFVYPNEIIELPVVLLAWQDAPPAADASNGSSASPSTSTSQLRLVDVFHTYVRPTARPQLSDFCKTLTGIQQEDIDRAPTFVQATVKLHDWMEAHDLLVLRGDEGDDEDSSGSASSPTSSNDDRIALDPSHRIYTSRLAKDVLWATHGAYDLRDFLPKSAWISKLHYGPPRWMNGPLLDVRKAVGKYMQRQAALAVSAAAAAATATGLCASSSSSSDGEGDVRRAPSAAASDAVASPATFRDGTIPALLSDLGLPPFEGRLHNGLDDTKNLARILIELSLRVGKEMAAAASAGAAGSQDHASPRVISTTAAQPPSSPSRPSASAPAPTPTPPPNTPPAGPRRWLAANKQRLLLHQRSASNSSISSSSSSSSLSSPVRPPPSAAATATASTPDRSSSASPSPLPAASAYLEPNYTLPDLPPPPSCDDAAGEASKSGWRYYPKRFAWMGKKVGIVKWHVVERQAEEGEGEDWVAEDRRAGPHPQPGTGMAVGVGVGQGQGQQQRPQQPQQQQQRPPVSSPGAAMGANGSVSGSGAGSVAAGGGGARKFQSARRRAGGLEQ